MNKENLKSLVKDFLSKGDVQKAISILLAWSEENAEELHDKIVMLSSEYENLKEKRLLRLEKSEELDRKLNEINYSLINFLSKVPEQTSTGFSGIFISEKKEPPKNVSSFGYWLQYKSIKVGGLFAFISGGGLILGISAVVIALLNHDELLNGEENFRQIAFIAIIANIIAALFAVIFISKVKINEGVSSRFENLLSGNNPASSSEYYERAKSATSEFIKFWKLTWIGWIILYILFFLKFYHKELDLMGIGDYLEKNIFTKENDFIIQIFIDACTNISSFGLIVCFSILYFRNNDRKDKHYENLITVCSLCLFLLIFIIQMVIFISAKVDVSPIYPTYPTIQGLFKIIVGLVAAVSVSLLAGRLDSKLINASIAFIIIAYVYAGIQSLISFFEPDFFTSDYKGLSHFAVAFAISYALFAKCVLFLFILWLINEGKLLLYIIRLNAIVEESKLE